MEATVDQDEMKTPKNIKARLRVIPGGLHRTLNFRGLHIVAAPDNSPPFTVQAMAYEEDTFLVMSADPRHAAEPAHPLRLMAELADLTPEKTGSVVVQGRHPVRLLAVVHDVDMNPTWREEWIEGALREIFALAEKHRFVSLGLPLLGTRYGKLDKPRFAGILGRIMRETAWPHLKRLWIAAPVPENQKLIRTLGDILSDC